ncbi:hypothetical protein [Mycolicibacterium phlei]
MAILEQLTVMWDDEVDVVCTGSGAAGLANAIAVADLDAEVFVADAAGRPAGRTWLDVGAEDPETSHYFTELSSDLGPLRRPTTDLSLPIRSVPSTAGSDSGRTVAPFVGARLREWAARCLATPYGFLSTRLPTWQSTVRTVDGEILEVSELGTLTVGSDDVGATVADWLTARCAREGIEVHSSYALRRLVFEEGDAIGAVFDTPEGLRAIRARHGVTVAGGASPIVSSVGNRLPADATMRICVVGQRASRFGRIELLTSEPLMPTVSPTCRARDRRLAVNMRETYRHSQPWRCTKVNRYPSLGE